MTLRREYFLVFLSPLVLVALGVGFLNAGRNAEPPVEAAPGENLYREIMDIVSRRYVVEPDEEALIYAAARGMVKTLDRHCEIYDADQWGQHRTTSRGLYAGIGILLGSLHNRVGILEVFAGSPAEKAGLRAGDRILKVGEETVPAGMPVDDVITLLRGIQGTRVKLSVIDLDTEKERVVEAERGSVEQTVAYGYMLDKSPGVGYVCLVSFRENTVPMLTRALARLRLAGMHSLILDLRGNRGGSLDAAVEIADRFIAQDVIVTTIGRREPRVHGATPTTPDRSLPLVVLVDGSSASASEVLAGALQDHSRAILVGERTYGKGVVQAVMPLQSRRGGYKLTTDHYFTPAGRCIEKSIALPGNTRRRGGIQPDVTIPLMNRERERNVNLRRRPRYAPRIQRILNEEDDIEDGYRDRHLAAAVSLLKGDGVPDQPLAEPRR